MKIKFTTLLYSLFTMVMLCLVSCNGGNQSVVDKDTKNEIGLDSVKTIKIYHLDNDSTKPTCSLKIDFVTPVIYKDTSVLQKIQHELNTVFFEGEEYATLSPTAASEKYAENYVNNYKTEMSQYTQWMDSFEADDYYSFYKTLEGKIVFNQGGLLSYQVVSLDDKGGASSFTTYQNLVFDLKSGERITESDIFVPDYKTTIDKLLTVTLMEQNKAKTIDAMLDIGFSGIEDLSSNNNFYVTADGITYVFNPGECSTPSIGALTIPLTYNQLKNILKPATPLSPVSGI